MFAYLFLHGVALLQLDDASFAHYVKNGDKDVPWFVMFGGPKCPSCSAALPEFANASSLAQGFCRFGYVDTARALTAVRSLDIHKVPTFLLFTDADHQNYSGPHSATAFVRFASEVIGEGIDEADGSWADRTDNYVILFTRQFRPPTAFSGAYGTMKRRGIAFGMARDSDTIEQFGNPRIPSIWFSKNGQKKIYKGKLEFTTLAASIAEFFGIEEGKSL
jgi:thiol-disulfide isomerase/thioredoxin